MSNLLEKASIITTPTAYNDGKLLSVKGGTPADFDFTRGSTATRINSSGLIESVSSGLPRIDYTDGIGSVLLEPQSTNLYLNSEPTTNEGVSGGVSYESFNWNIGFSNCVRYGDNSSIRYRYGGSVLASTEYTLSAFVIMDDLSEPIIGGQVSTADFTFVIGGGIYANANANIYIGNNIWKVSVTGTTSGSPSVNNTGILKYTSQSSKGFRVVGFQLEANKSFATSYIPTNGSTATRLAETLNNAGSSDLINSTEGVLYAEIAALSDDLTFREISISSGHSSNSIAIKYRNTSNVINFTIVSGGSSVFNTSETVPNIKDFNKVALKYKSGDIAIWINGVEMTTSASLFTNTSLSEISFDNGSGYNDFYGNVKCVAVFKEALTDAELTQLTTI